MAIDSTTLMSEVQTILEDPRSAKMAKLTAMIKIGEEWLTPIRLETLTRRRDYLGAYGDILLLDVTVGLGDLTYLIEPGKDHLMVDIFTEYKTGHGKYPTDDPIEVTRYRAILLTRFDGGLTNPLPQASNREDLNKQLVPAEFQLIDENAYQLGKVTLGRTYRQLTPVDALKGMLTEASQQVDLEEQHQVVGVDVAPGYNTTPREVIVIPHGTPLTKLAEYLQTKEGGIYGTGIGCYLQHNTWYVYPLYALKRFEDEARTLTIVRIPTNRLAATERSYRVTDTQVIVIANQGVTANDQGRDHQINQGEAVRAVNADQLLTFGDVKDNKVSFQRRENLYEFREETGQETPVTKAQWQPQGATTNPFTLYSRLAAQNVQLLEVQWFQGDIDLLYPGMPVQYMVANNDQLLTHTGILLGANDRFTPHDPGPVTDVHNNEATLLIAVNRH